MMKLAVRQCREKKKMSQEELAKRSGISRQTISSIENGAFGSVLMSTLMALANALDVDVQNLFFDDND